MAELKKLGKYKYELELDGRIKPTIFANEEIIQVLRNDEANQNNPLKQLQNLSQLPGFLGITVAPDVHVGYGCPIGTTTASSMKEGVITFAATGFDINCLSGDSKVMHELGYTKKIRDFEDSFIEEKIKIFDGGLNNAQLVAFQKVRPKKLLKIRTETGRELFATPEHPFYTKDGKKPLEKIVVGERVLANPFVGVEYTEPVEEILLTKEKVLEYCINKSAQRDVLRKLESNNPLPLKTTTKKVGVILKLLGYLQGDGNLTMTKSTNKVSFYGAKEDLIKIRSDLKSLGFDGYLCSRERKHEIKTIYGTSNFTYLEHSLTNSSLALCVLFKELGATVGNKARVEMRVPFWLKKQPLWMKRLFLAGLFGAEMSTPAEVSGAKFNLAAAVVSQNKQDSLAESGKNYLEELRDMLKEFEITSSVNNEITDYVNDKGLVSIRNRLVVNLAPENLIRLYSRIGFEYNEKRRVRANYAIQYLLLKQKIITERVCAEKEAIALHAGGMGAKRISVCLKDKFPNVNKRFYERSIYGGRKTLPRVAFNGMGFEEFIESENLSNGFVWDTVESISETSKEEFVYDFTVNDYNHNFIANCFVVGNCGVHSLVLPLTVKEVEEKKKELADQLFRDVPAGLGIRGKLVLKKSEMDEVLTQGAEFVVKKGFGSKKDLQFMEENGCINGANSESVSDKAKERALDQIGTLGSGNHYCEVQEIEKILDEKSAKAFGLEKGGVVVSIHCGSRALGHQIGTDYLEVLDGAVKKYGLSIPERDLVCAPIQSEEGQRYFSAIKAGTNAAFANRFVIGSLVKKSIAKVFGVNEEDTKTLYDIGHNTAKLEKHLIDGKKLEVLVQRKGSTRGFGPGQAEVPAKYRRVGQPVIVGGSMGTNSFILKGTEKAMSETFGSTIHGAGRSMSRTAALKKHTGEELLKQLNEKGIIVKARSIKGLPEEAPDAYKDILSVVEVMHKAGVSEKVAKLKPLICIKG
jgi:tRNA-splicing ligase RtcB